MASFGVIQWHALGLSKGMLWGRQGHALGLSKGMLWGRQGHAPC